MPATSPAASWRRSRTSTRSASARRPTRPSAAAWACSWRAARSSARDVRRPRLPDHRDLDHPGVVELALDLARDLPREALGPVVVDLGGPDDDPDLPTRLHGVGALHARLGRGQVLERV